MQAKQNPQTITNLRTTTEQIYQIAKTEAMQLSTSPQIASKIANRISRIFRMGWYDNHPNEVILNNLIQAFTDNVFNSSTQVKTND